MNLKAKIQEIKAKAEQAALDAYDHFDHMTDVYDAILHIQWERDRQIQEITGQLTW